MSDFRPLQQLREDLRAAAEREMAATPPSPARRRRVPWRGRPLLAAAFALICVGGVATAADLISVGEPEPDAIQRSEAVRPSGLPAIDVTAPDRPLQWGVTPYEAPDGQSCSIAGQVRAGRLGLIQGGTFRPYATSTGGGCVDLRKLSYAVDVRQFGARTLLYGRARPRVARVLISERDGGRSTADVGKGGTFLFVFDGRLRPQDYRVEAYDSAGRVVEP